MVTLLLIYYANTVNFNYLCFVWGMNNFCHSHDTAVRPHLCLSACQYIFVENTGPSKMLESITNSLAECLGQESCFFKRLVLKSVYRFTAGRFHAQPWQPQRRYCVQSSPEPIHSVYHHNM